MIFNYDKLNFNVLTIIRSKHNAGYFEVKKRPYAAISYKISGNAEFEIANKMLCTKPNDILFIPANMDYKVKYSLNDSIIIHLEDCNYITPECFSLENSRLFEYLFMNLLKLWENNHSEIQAKACIYDILYKISQENRIKNPAFEKVLEQINMNFCRSDLKISEICKICYLSESTVQRLFLINFGISPKQYLLKLRLDKALNMIEKGCFSIKEIASLCGFLDEKYFSRVFRKKIGVPPSGLLKKQ